MILHVSACPKCGGTDFAVEVKSWVNVEANQRGNGPFSFDATGFDQEDADYAEPIEGGEIICRNSRCVHRFTNEPVAKA